MTETATQAKSSTSPIDVARSFFAAYNAHDVERMVAACSEDAELRYVPMGSQGRGNARELGKSIWSGLIDAFPDLAVTVESIFGDERNVAAEVVIGGRISSRSAARAGTTICLTRSCCRRMSVA